MSDDLYDASAWATAFGLADAPLFAPNAQASESHRVLVDGGNGSFVLSIDDADLPATLRQSWVWSADVPHHVWLHRDQVAVARWDDDGPPKEFSLSSVSARLDTFYDYLTFERVDRTRSVVNHALRFFRFIRSAVAGVGVEDSLSVDVFLAVLAALARNAKDISYQAVAAEAKDAMLDERTAEIFGQLGDDRVRSLTENFRRLHLGRHTLELNTDLALRHASGLIFQESHFELLRAPDPDLLGYVEAPTVRTDTRGGVHFTPPAIARVVVERTIDATSALLEQPRITIFDPACGSGAFLQEALRAIGRTGYSGALHLVGRDISSHAVKMARFALLRAAADHSNHKSIQIEVTQRDFFEDDDLPEPDIVVMNPPFIAFGALNDRQRQVMNGVFGDARQGRADYCTAFISRAVQLLKRGGALGTLFPANLLFLDNAKAWRRSLLDAGSLRFIASIGEHALFAQAFVQVGSMVIVKEPSGHDLPVLTVLTTDDRSATGEALRAVRKVAKNPGLPASDKGWEVGWLPEKLFRTSLNWRLRSSKLTGFLQRLSAPGLIGVKDVFHVQQGVQTGSYEVFVLPNEQWKMLPKAERRFFRKAIMNQSVRMGAIHETHMVFYPYDRSAPLFETEAELAAAVPRYFQSHLQPARTRLAGRPAVRGRKPAAWWLLNRPRSWAANIEPRIVSKYFGEVGGFAFDAEGEFMVVQGFGWNTRPGYMRRLAKARQEYVELCSPGFLRAYWNVLNSRPFMVLVSAFSKQVAGGQFDLGPRFVDEIPIPDLVDINGDESREQIVLELESEDFDWTGNLARRRQLGIDEMVARLYGIPLDEWPL